MHSDLIGQINALKNKLSEQQSENEKSKEANRKLCDECNLLQNEIKSCNFLSAKEKNELQEISKNYSLLHEEHRKSRNTIDDYTNQINLLYECIDKLKNENEHLTK